MSTESLRHILAQHPYFEGLDDAHLDLLTGCAKNLRFEQDVYLFHEGEEANDFYLVRHGSIGIEVDVRQQPLTVNSVGPGEVLGWSWLVPPHRWGFHARALELTRALALDGACLRRKCEADTDFASELLKRFAHDIEKRLYRAWLQIADVYGK